MLEADFQCKHNDQNDNVFVEQRLSLCLSASPNVSVTVSLWLLSSHVRLIRLISTGLCPNDSEPSLGLCLTIASPPFIFYCSARASFLSDRSPRQIGTSLPLNWNRTGNIPMLGVDSYPTSLHAANTLQWLHWSSMLPIQLLLNNRFTMT